MDFILDINNVSRPARVDQAPVQERRSGPPCVTLADPAAHSVDRLRSYDPLERLMGISSLRQILNEMVDRTIIATPSLPDIPIGGLAKKIGRQFRQISRRP
jgi:hypothetical protein